MTYIGSISAGYDRQLLAGCCLCSLEAIWQLLPPESPANVDLLQGAPVYPPAELCWRGGEWGVPRGRSSGRGATCTFL
jgi:hypothetical protein